MKIYLRNLKKMLREELQTIKLHQLRETVAMELTDEPDSVDEQIDAFLVKLEKQSQPGKDQTVETILARKSLRFLLEADEDVPDASQDDKTTLPDPTAEDPKSEDPSKVSPENDTRKPNVKPGEFAIHVARLIDNYESLLDIKRIILVRALKYAQTNLNNDVAEQMADVLQKKFGISLAKNEDEQEELIGDPAVAIGGNSKIA